MACFVFSGLPAAFLLFPVSVLLLCRCFFVSFSLPFFCLYFFSLYVSVLVSSCAVSPVSLFLVSDTRVSCIPRPGCHTMPFRISVFSFSLPLFLSACMRIYYNVSLLPGFPSSLKKYVLQHICQSAFYKKCSRETRKNSLIYLVCML